MVKIKIFDYDTNPSTATPILIFERIVIKILYLWHFFWNTQYETTNWNYKLRNSHAVWPGWHKIMCIFVSTVSTVVKTVKKNSNFNCTVMTTVHVLEWTKFQTARPLRRSTINFHNTSVIVEWRKTFKP